MEENGKLVQFIFRGDEVVAEETANNIILRLRGYDLIASDAEHAKTYYHYASDELGSTTHVVDDREVLNRYEYDVWGDLNVCEETVENRFKFNGQQYDPIAQQYYLRARYYNPVIARFTQEDTYRGAGLNLYAYCWNNPVYHVDPSGHLPNCVKDAIEANMAQGNVGQSSEAGSPNSDARNTGTAVPKVEAELVHIVYGDDGKPIAAHEYRDANPTARDDNYKYSGEIKVADANNGKGLTAINTMAERAHAEVGAMNQSFSDVNKPRGGEGFLIVNALGLERLTVVENSSGNVYVFDVNAASQNGNKNPFLNVRQGGLRWKEARVQPN